MTSVSQSPPWIAIACGGTGGHLFPGVAVAGQLRRRGCAVTLLISQKEVDQKAVKMAAGVEIASLPAVGLNRGREIAFLLGFIQSYRAAGNLFKARTPLAVLAMGGFTSAPPILAARRAGARTFLHESNVIPGRANRWLSWMISGAFVGFSSAASRLHTRRVTVTGTPVRAGFQPRPAAACRAELGLDPNRPVLLVMGGSQGASGINSLVVRSLPLFAKSSSDVQWFHLTGSADADKVEQAYAALNLDAIVHPFFENMELALGAATVAISRAGGSSLAELAAMRVPSLLVPYPAAADNHQYHNAFAFEATGAARLLEQRSATPEILHRLLTDLLQSAFSREKMQTALAQWQAPRAAEQIAEAMLRATETEVRGCCAAGDRQGTASDLKPKEDKREPKPPQGPEPALASAAQPRGEAEDKSARLLRGVA
jgi:UDP-N-acetylglucosamine--N-acetylmuramyl-(pentapeptide) pyrophosphoryl-undecaprenol N-acetylglucosamine transferase